MTILYIATTLLFGIVCACAGFGVSVWALSAKYEEIQEKEKAFEQDRDEPTELDLTHDEQAEILYHMDQLNAVDEAFSMQEVHARWGMGGVRFLSRLAEGRL